MRVRRLTDEGVEEFKDYLAELEGAEEVNPPNLDRARYSERVEEFDAEIDPEKTFETRMEMAKYLAERLETEELETNQIIQMNRMWSWFAYVWLEQFCRETGDGISVYAMKAYICSNDWKRYYRHFVGPAYYIYTLYGEEHSKLFLECSAHIRNEFIGQLAARQSVLRHEAIIKAAHEVYWDEDENSIKSGASSKNKPGTARRLGTVIKQLEMIHDLHGMESDEIVNILPKEFERWQDEEENEEDQEEESDSISDKFRSLVE